MKIKTNVQMLLTLALMAVSMGSLNAQQDDVEMRAMRDEMKRSVKDLHLASTDLPYYVQYKIVDTRRLEADATLGALVASGETRTRMLSVSVRVGNYDLDSSGSSAGGVAGLASLLVSLGVGGTLPLDDNYDELRRRIWLSTDTAYKKAVEDLSRKKAALANTGRGDSIPNFSKEPARQETQMLPPVEVSVADAEHLVRAASGVFLKLPMVEGSQARFEVTNATEHFLNSEGTSYMRQVPDVFFQASATLQGPTGETFSDSYSEYGHARADLPAEAALVQGSQEVVDRLANRHKGKTAKKYNGPVLFEGDAAAELVARHFANLLSAHAAAGGSTNILTALLTGPTASLVNKIGSRVLPDFLSVTDNPNLTAYDGHTLYGSYKFDEEGVPSRETVLIKEGMLKTLLTSRTPVRGMLLSTGSMREHGVLPGNLFVDATKTSTREELIKQLTDLVSARGLEYGYILRKLSGNQAIEAIRVYPDGHQDTVRDARVAEITASSFKDILAVSKDRTVYTDRAQGGALLGLGSGADLVTYIVPDLLFEDMTVEHTPNESPKLPDIPSPIANGK